MDIVSGGRSFSMLDFVLVMLISMLMGLGIGGETASLLEGGGPQRFANSFVKYCKRWKELFYA